MLIYTPLKRAREYSPLALNIYNGCDHGCKYCYIRTLFLSNTQAKERNLSKLEKELPNINNQVLLCFISDPYCQLDRQVKATRRVLELFQRYDVPTAILTKGGLDCLRDMDIISKMKYIKVGATLTFINAEDSKKYEPEAALPEDRFEALKQYHDAGIRTWASLEPVIDPEQSLATIEITKDYVDEYKVGKLNHLKNTIDWRAFGNRAVDLLLKYGKDFYVKSDLFQFMADRELDKKHTDMDFLCIKKTEITPNLQSTMAF